MRRFFRYRLIGLIASLALGGVRPAVAAVDPPVSNGIANVDVFEDAPASTVDLFQAFDDPDHLDAELSFSVIDNTNAALFAGVTIDPGTGILTLSYLPNVSGAATLTVRATDPLGEFADASFSVTVTPVNDPPTTSGISPVSVLEDAGNSAVDLFAAFDDVEDDDASLSYSVVSNTNAGLFTSTAIAGGALTLDVAANANGSATLTVRATDTGGLFVDAAFTVTVTAVNDAPGFTRGGDISLGEDAGPQTFAGWATGLSAGPTDEAGQTLTFATSNTNNALFSVQPAVSSIGTLTFTPAPNISGSAVVTVTLSDNGGTANGGVDTSAPQTFTITVNNVNDPPTTSGISPVTVLEDAGNTLIDLFAAFADAEDADANLSYSVVSNTNAGLFASTAIAGGSLTLDYAANSNGTATLTVRATDTGGLFVDAAFTVTVTAVNDAPSFVKGPDQTAGEGGPPVSIANWATALSPGPANESTQTLSFATSNNNNGLFTTQPAVSSTGTLTFNVANDVSGVATVTVTLSDNGGTANGGLDTSAPQTFTITVNNVNDAPTTSGIANITDNEDAAGRTVNLWAAFADAEDTDAQLTYTITANSNPALFASLPINTAAGTLALNYTVDASGTANLTVRATDTGGLFVEAPFTVTVNPVNDPPRFTKGVDQSVQEDSPAQTVAGWATGIAPGPADEASQTVTFSVTTPSAALFSVQPAIAPNGTLTYTPAPNAFGTAVVTVVLQDNGGTANGGVNQSAAQTFNIAITGVNDLPVAVDDTYSVSEGGSVIAAAGGSPPGVLDNDRDPDGQTLTATIIRGPQYAATWSFNTNGSFVYVHNGSEETVDTITYVASDGVGTSNVATITLNIQESNDPPQTSGIGNVTALEDAADGAIALFGSFSDPDHEDDELVYTVQANTNPGLFTSTTINGQTGILTLNYAPNANGAATLTIRATDPGGLFVQTTFTVTVTPVNDAPTLTPGPAIDLDEDPGPQSFPGWATGISPGPADEASQALTISVSNDNTSLFAVQPILTVSGSSAALSFTPAPQASGLANVSITVSDNGGVANGGQNSASFTFQISINSDNDPPTSIGIADITVFEDAEPLVYNLFEIFDDVEDPDTALVFSIETAPDETLVASAGIAGNPALLTITFQPDAFGTTSLSVRATDTGGQWKQEDVAITIGPVNDAPSFTAGPDQALAQNAPPQRIDGWATDIVPGPENEDDQTVLFEVTTDNAALFIVPPAIEPDGTLTYAPAQGEAIFGQAIVTVTLIDDGGTENGGIDRSLAQSFTIRINRFNTAPVAANDNYVVRQGAVLTVPAASGVLANDTDAEGDPLAARVVTPPVNATQFTLNPDGSFTYRHNNTPGTVDSFTYIASDGIDDSPAATVQIAITPTGSLTLPDVEVLEDTPSSIVSMAGVFASQFPAGAVLRYSLVTNPLPPLLRSVDVDSLAGIATLLFTPNASGVVSLSFRASSDAGLTRVAALTVTVLPLNDTPVAVDDIAATIENEPVLIDVLANDVDPDGDALVIQSFSSPTAGTVQPGADGTFLYNPPADYTGRASFTYTVVDDSSTTDRAMVSITVFAGRFDIVDLGTIGSAASAAFGISNAGEVVGAAVMPEAGAEAFSSVRPLFIEGPSTAYDVNDFGTVVGAHLNGETLLAARWDSLGLTHLGAFDGRSSLAYGINNEGRIVGASTYPDLEVLRAFLWRDERLNELPTPEGAESQAFDISERGLAVGYTGNNAAVWEGLALNRTLSGIAGRAYALNESNQIVGSIDDGTVKAAFWERNGTLQLIHDAASSFSEAYGINNSTWVVGAYLPASTGKAGGNLPARRATTAHPLAPAIAVSAQVETRAFLWRNGTKVDLNAFIDAGAGWTLLEATGINNAAQIVGVGLLSGVRRAFLLTPSTNAAPEPEDDTAALSFFEAIEIDLLANDRDSDGDSLRVESVTQGRAGNVTLRDDRVAVYTPGPGFEEEDRFTYVVRDARGGRAEATVLVRRGADALPTAFGLEQNYPNPFNPVTTIVYALPHAEAVTLEVFNLLGQRVAILVDGPRPAGRHRVVFDATALPAGVYVYRVRAGQDTAGRKLVLLK